MLISTWTAGSLVSSALAEPAQKKSWQLAQAPRGDSEDEQRRKGRDQSRGERQEQRQEPRRSAPPTSRPAASSPQRPEPRQPRQTEQQRVPAKEAPKKEVRPPVQAPAARGQAERQRPEPVERPVPSRREPPAQKEARPPVQRPSPKASAEEQRAAPVRKEVRPPIQPPAFSKSRDDRKDARDEPRGDRREVKGDQRDDRKDARDMRREGPKDARDERRDDRKEVRDERRDDRKEERADQRFRRLDDVKQLRRQRVEDGGRRVVIEEPGNRMIVREQGRMIIRHDDTERFRRRFKDTRVERKRDGTTETVFIRPDGVQIVSVVDSRGRLLHRYRRYRDGRTVVLIDNRRYHRPGFVEGLFLGAILNLRPPVIRIPREKYIVEYEDASYEDIYEALTAPPVDDVDLERGYSLDEIRYNQYLRERMRRIDLDSIYFEFGSWEVAPDQYYKLERIAKAINRLLEERPDEIIMIEGHTDAVGSEEDNMTLSDHRAETVAMILSEEFGVPAENLVTQGYGEQFLKIQTEGPERQNRRVSVRRITPLLARSVD